MIARPLLCFILVLGVASSCFAQGNTSDIDKQFTADVLKTTLFTRTAEERRFCDYVIQKRDDGSLPARLIYGAYQKAMTKERHQRFVYFKTSLELLCKREGVVLYPPPTPAKTSSTTSSSSLSSFFPFVLRGFIRRN